MTKRIIGRFEKILDWATMAGAAFGLVVTIAVITGLSFDLAHAQFQPNPGTVPTPLVPGESCGSNPGFGVPHGGANSCIHGFTGGADIFFGHVGIHPLNSSYTPSYISGGGGSVATLTGSDSNFAFVTSSTTSTSVTFQFANEQSGSFWGVVPSCTVTLNKTAAGAAAVTSIGGSPMQITISWPTTTVSLGGWVHCFGNG